MPVPSLVQELVNLEAPFGQMVQEAMLQESLTSSKVLYSAVATPHCSAHSTVQPTQSAVHPGVSQHPPQSLLGKSKNVSQNVGKAVGILLALLLRESNDSQCKLVTNYP